MRAARLLGAADALREAIGVARPAAYANDYDRQMGAAVGLLGRDGFSAAWGAGRTLALDDAVSEALAPLDEPRPGDSPPTTKPG
jgi:hypothetical protein